MSIVRMKKLCILTLRSGSDALLERLQGLGCMEMSEIDASDGAAQTLTRPDSTAEAALRQTVAQLQRGAEVLRSHIPKQKGLFRIRPVVSEQVFFDEKLYTEAKAVAAEVGECEKKTVELQGEQQRLLARIAELQPWRVLDAPLGLTDTESLRFRYGTLPVNAALPASDAPMQLFSAGVDREKQYFLLICHADAEEETLAALKALGWAEVRFSEQGTAAESIRALEAQRTQTETALAAQSRQLDRLGAQYERLLAALDRAQSELLREQNRNRLLVSEQTAYLEGWVPEERWPELRRLLQEQGCAWDCRTPEESEYGSVPVKLRNNVLTRPLNMVTEMYSLPAYGTVDPNPLMAPFFILFYGIMMADIGYGLLMILTALYIRGKYRPKDGMAHFFALLLECGISTLCMGLLTGGFFGDFLTQLLAMLRPGTVFALPKLFDPLNDIVMILIGSLCLGFVQIVTGMAVGFAEKCRHGHYADALFEEITWWIVFAGLALALLGKTRLLFYLGAALVPAGPLVQGKGMGKLTGIFASLYNHITGFFGDILSYSRLMALMLAGSVIAQVFNMLGTLTGNVVLYLVIAMLGNALNFSLNLLGCYVHDLRLQCLEFFGKFYVDGGRPFRPLAYQTKYYDIK